MTSVTIQMTIRGNYLEECSNDYPDDYPDDYLEDRSTSRYAYNEKNDF